MKRLSNRTATLLSLAAALILVPAKIAMVRAWGAEPATIPIPSTAVQHLTAEVTAVQGKVQYRPSADADWKPCTVGLTLSEGAEFRTGARSSVSFVIPPHQTITLDRLSVIKLLEAVQQNGKYTTDMGMKYGRTRYDIEAAGVEHESTVRSPNGTLAVRDTSFAVDDERPFPPEAYRLSGTVDFSTAKRTISIGGSIPGPVKAIGDQSPAESSLASAIVDPNSSLSRTPAEASLVASVLSRGAVLTEMNPKQVPIVSGGTVPSETEIEKNLPGNLTFVLFWNGNANLDLRVDSQKTGEELYPATPLNTTRSGGLIPYNDIGGANGGIEYAYWKNSFPLGRYFVIVNDISGVPVDFTAEVFENKSMVAFTSTDFSAGTAPTFTGTINAGNNKLGIIDIATNSGGGSGGPGGGGTGGGGGFPPLPTLSTHQRSRSPHTTIASQNTPSAAVRLHR